MRCHDALAPYVRGREVMTPLEAAGLVDAIADSIRTDPGQFHLELKVIGQSIVSHGGIGMAMSVTGGGPGSKTIGNKVSVGPASVEIARSQAGQAMDQQAVALLEQLATISAELRKPEPDRGLLRSTLASLKNTWVPGVIIGVLGNLLSKAVGI